MGSLDNWLYGCLCRDSESTSTMSVVESLIHRTTRVVQVESYLYTIGYSAI